MNVDKIEMMIIGAQKAGTSSLIRYLGFHPGVQVHAQEEITCFVNDDEYALGVNESIRKNYADDRRAVRVGKSVGIMYYPEALKRLALHNPSMHIVVVLREPVKRAYSAYWYARRMGWEDIEQFADAIDAGSERYKDDWVRQRNCDYLGRSQYLQHMENIYSSFPEQNVHVYLFEEMIKNPQQVCSELWEILGLEPVQLPLANKKFNTASLSKFPLLNKILRNVLLRHIAKIVIPSHFIRNRMRQTLQAFNRRPAVIPRIDAKLERELKDKFTPMVERLADKIGRDLSIWRD